MTMIHYFSGELEKPLGLSNVDFLSRISWTILRPFAFQYVKKDIFMVFISQEHQRSKCLRAAISQNSSILTNFPIYLSFYCTRQLKGQSNEIFYLLLFHFSQATYSVFKDFSNLASNSRRYSQFFIDSPLLFIAESQYSSYCFIPRVATLRFIIAGSHYLLVLSA
jgi:hypothetical protein